MFAKIILLHFFKLGNYFQRQKLHFEVFRCQRRNTCCSLQSTSYEDHHDWPLTIFISLIIPCLHFLPPTFNILSLLYKLSVLFFLTNYLRTWESLQSIHNPRSTTSYPQQWIDFSTSNIQYFTVNNADYGVSDKRWRRRFYTLELCTLTMIVTTIPRLVKYLFMIRN